MARIAKPYKTPYEEATETCPYGNCHDVAPHGYLEWHAWAEKMAAAREQRECPGCGFTAFWIPATDFCSTCSHSAFAHTGDESGGTSCAISECTCEEKQ